MVKAGRILPETVEDGVTVSELYFLREQEIVSTPGSRPRPACEANVIVGNSTTEERRELIEHTLTR